MLTDSPLCAGYAESRERVVGNMAGAYGSQLEGIDAHQPPLFSKHWRDQRSRHLTVKFEHIMVWSIA